MKIFDEIERTYQQPATHHESTFCFLNRSARPACERIRNELELWFSRYPVAHQNEFIGRIRREFYSPFFELLLHEVFLRLQAAVTPHPAIGSKGRRPEFLAEFSEDRQLVIEATLCNDQDLEASNEEKRTALIYDAIDQIDSPYFYVNVNHVEEADRNQIAPSRVVAFLTRELDHLDPSALLDLCERRKTLPRLTFRDRGSRIEFTVVPKKRDAWGRENSRVLGMHGVNSRWGGNDSSLLQVLSRKGKHYGQIGLPFLVAVNTLGPWGTMEEDRAAALFGAQQESVATFTGELRVRQLENGLWGTASNPKYSRLSSVLMGTALPWNVPRIDFCLYINPWATHPVFDLPWPFRTAVMTKNGLVYSQPKSSLAELLQLSEDWPGPLFDN